MKKVKDIFALVIAMVMILAMGTTALAVDITVSKDSKNIDPSAITYTYYKIFDATYTSNTTTDTTIAGTDGTQAKTEGFAYTIPATSPLLTISGGNASIDDVTGITLTLNGAGDAYSVEYEGQMTEDAAKAMATALQNKINTLTNTQKDDLTSGNLTWNQASNAYKATGLDKGYYLIESDYNSTLVLATSDIQINEKNSYVTDKKELVNAADDSVQIGDIIPYKITVNVPAGSNQQIVITDTYEAGLTPQVAAATGEYAVDDTKSPSTAGQVYVTATVDSATNLTFAVSEPSSASGTAGHFTITLTDEQVTDLAGKTIIFTYYAELNANATVVDRTVRPGHLANNNTVTLKYGNDYDKELGVYSMSLDGSNQKACSNVKLSTKQPKKIKTSKGTLISTGRTYTDDDYYPEKLVFKAKNGKKKTLYNVKKDKNADEYASIWYFTIQGNYVIYKTYLKGGKYGPDGALVIIKTNGKGKKVFYRRASVSGW